MPHDHNGRVGPPRCEECNAPLISDERRLGSTSTSFRCLECDRSMNPFAGLKLRTHRRRRRRWRAPQSAFSVECVPHSLSA